MRNVKMSGSFRAFVWDPLLLCSQIVLMQSTFYSVLSMTFFSSIFFGYSPSLNGLLTPTPSRSCIIAQLLSSLVCAFVLSRVIQRAKQCLDFTCTIHLFHLVFICIYTHSFPHTMSWWLLQLSSITLCTVLGEYLCMNIESREIKLVGIPSKYDL